MDDFPVPRVDMPADDIGVTHKYPLESAKRAELRHRPADDLRTGRRHRRFSYWKPLDMTSQLLKAFNHNNISVRSCKITQPAIILRVTIFSLLTAQVNPF
jgi:hypothetical protein